MENCPDPALCQRLKKHIHGRLWEIWNGVNIEPAKAQAYRQIWEMQANLSNQLPKGVLPEGKPKSGGGCGCSKKS